MNKKSGDFSMDDLKRLAESPAGRQLISMMTKADSGQVQKAVKLANAGQFNEAQKALQSVINDPEIQRLAKQLGGTNG